MIFTLITNGIFPGWALLVILCLINFPSGYQLSAQAMTTVLKRYSRILDDGRSLIAFDDFVALSVRLRAYTGKNIIRYLNPSPHG